MESDWAEVVDRLLSAFAHDANGRTGSVGGLVELVETGATPDVWLPLLREEVDRLAGHAGALRAIAADLGPEPLDIRDIIALAARTLFAARVRLVLSEIAPGTVVAVYASRTAVVRAIVLTLLHGMSSDMEAVVRTKLERRGDRIVLQLLPERPAERKLAPTALTLVEPYDGTLTLVDGGFELTLPALG
jgi:hypothetical protein